MEEILMKTIDVNKIVVRAEQTPGQAKFDNFEELKEYMEKVAFDI